MRRAAVLVCLLLPAAALAQDPPLKTAALDKLQGEMTVCLAYYGMAKNCVPDGSAEAQALSEKVDLLTARTYSVGKSIGMNTDAMMARLNAALDQNSAILAKSCANIGKLHQAHAARCKVVVEDPNAVYGEFVK
jgi:hypothetical protein